MKDGPERKPRLVLVDYLPDDVDAYYRPSPPEIVVNRQRWAQMSRAERAALIVHEVGHHATQTLHTVDADPFDRGTVIKREAMADRAGLECRISDEAISRALRQGWSTVAELADDLEVPESVVEARLRVWRRQWG